MTFQGDPYRTLGVPQGASLNEIRAAYRRLVKQYHPDAAGERALPRFLAIQAAYERLVDSDGRLRTGRAGGVRRGAGSAPGGEEASRADSARARASRDAWRARRTAGASAGPGASAGTGAAGRASSGAGGGPTSGTRGRRGGSRAGPRDTGGAGDPRTGERTGRRGPRKATPGSTTYDEASEAPRDPEWDGGAWYGPSSGTYWTLNPREYADPRKHGPEYLARARRAAHAADGAEAGAAAGDAAEGSDRAWGGFGPAEGGPAAGGDGATTRDVPGTGGGQATGTRPEPTPETDAEGRGGRWRWSGAGRTTTDGGAAEWGTRSWTYDPAGATGTAWTEGAGDRRRADADGRRAAAGDRRADRPHAGSGAPDGAPLPDLETLARRAAPLSLLAIARRPDPRWRLAVALLGWPAVGFAVGSLLSMADGCASPAAVCPEPLPILPLVAQPLVVAGLFLVPAAAAVTAFASIIALAAAVPVAAVLSVGTLPESRVGAPVLGGLTAVAYVAALAAATVVVWQARAGADDPGP